MAWLSLPSWRWVCDTPRCRQLLLEYIIKWSRMNAHLINLLSVATDLESLSGQQLIDAALYVWRLKVHREKHTSTQLSANVPISTPVHSSPAQTNAILIIGISQVHDSGLRHVLNTPHYTRFSSRHPECFQPQLRRCLYIAVNCFISGNSPEENDWNFIKDLASRMDTHQVLIINFVPQSASTTNKAVIWRTVYEQVSKGPNTWLRQLPINWKIYIKRRPVTTGAGQSTSGN